MIILAVISSGILNAVLFWWFMEKPKLLLKASFLIFDAPYLGKVENKTGISYPFKMRLSQSLDRMKL